MQKAEHYEKVDVVQYSDCDVPNPPARCMPTDNHNGFNTKCRDEPFHKLRPIHRWRVGKALNLVKDGQFDIGMDTIRGDPLWPNNRELDKWNMYRDTTQSYNITGTQQRGLEGRWEFEAGEGIPRAKRRYFPVAHPIHLHGHDFAFLQQSDESYRLDNLKLKLENPPHRDVVLMPSDGYIVVAFKADNPGIWLMHCHIAWHASAGLAMQLLENIEDLTNSIDASDRDQMGATCDAWNQWLQTPDAAESQQDDSGI